MRTSPVSTPVRAGGAADAGAEVVLMHGETTVEQESPWEPMEEPMLEQVDIT